MLPAWAVPILEQLIERLVERIARGEPVDEKTALADLLDDLTYRRLLREAAMQAARERVTDADPENA